MELILTITLNPAIDKSFTVDRLEPDHKLRSPNPRVDAGGGGINVSRGIGRLGGEALAFILAGGHNGSYLQELIAGEGMRLKVFNIEGETRESIMVMEAYSGKVLVASNASAKRPVASITKIATGAVAVDWATA